MFDKSGEVSLAPVTDKYGRTYNPKYELTQEQITEIDRRYGVTTEAAMRTANESPYNYTLDLEMDNVGQMFDELLNRYDVDEKNLRRDILTVALMVIEYIQIGSHSRWETSINLQDIGHLGMVVGI